MSKNGCGSCFKKRISLGEKYKQLKVEGYLELENIWSWTYLDSELGKYFILGKSKPSKYGKFPLGITSRIFRSAPGAPAGWVDIQSRTDVPLHSFLECDNGILSEYIWKERLCFAFEREFIDSPTSKVCSTKWKLNMAEQRVLHLVNQHHYHQHQHHYHHVSVVNV